MADQKQVNIRIDGNAAGLNATVRDAGDNVRKAFEDLGLGDILGDADKKFEDIAEKAKYVKEKLEEAKKAAKEGVDVTGATNDFGRNKLRQEGESKVEKNFDQLNKNFEELIKALKQSQREGKSGRPDDMMAGYEKYKSHMTPEQYQQWQLKQRKSRAERMIRGLGDEEEDVPSAGHRMAAAGARGNVQGALNTGISGQGGLLEAAGMGAGAGLVVGAIAAAAIAALAASINAGLQQGRAEGKANAAFDIRKSGYGEGYDFDEATGMSKTEGLNYGIRIARARGFAGSDLRGDAEQRGYMQKGYGVDEGSMQSLDKYSIYAGAGKSTDATNIIADILSRSQKDGILGVSRGDFNRLPEKIESVSNILAMQKLSSETVDPNFAARMVVGGAKIGGEFADDRISKVMGGLNEGIKHNANAGMQAFIYQMLQRANPGSTRTDILAKQEQGATEENMRAIMPSIMGMQKGEFRRQILHNMGLDWQTSKRLDETDKASEFMRIINGRDGQTTPSEIAKMKEEAKNRSGSNQQNVDNLTLHVKNASIDVGDAILNGLHLGTDEGYQHFFHLGDGWNAKGRSNKMSEESFNKLKTGQLKGMSTFGPK